MWEKERWWLQCCSCLFYTTGGGWWWPVSSTNQNINSQWESFTLRRAIRCWVSHSQHHAIGRLLGSSSFHTRVTSPRQSKGPETPPPSFRPCPGGSLGSGPMTALWAAVRETTKLLKTPRHRWEGRAARSSLHTCRKSECYPLRVMFWVRFLRCWGLRVNAIRGSWCPREGLGALGSAEPTVLLREGANKPLRPTPRGAAGKPATVVTWHSGT